MLDHLKIDSKLTVSIERTRALATLTESKGLFILEHWRDGKLIQTIDFHNGATDSGKQYALGAAFAGTAPISAWYLGLIDGTSGTPTLAPGDTPGGHAGWGEFVLYDEVVRQTWAKTVNTLNNTVASTAPCQFTISAGIPSPSYVAGGFLASASGKGATTGTLWAHGLFSAAVPVQPTDIFKLNYTTGL